VAEKFVVGDKVFLKAGGPEMVVDQVSDSTDRPNGTVRVRCQWFAGKKLDCGVFPPESLVREDPRPKALQAP